MRLPFRGVVGPNRGRRNGRRAPASPGAARYNGTARRIWIKGGMMSVCRTRLVALVRLVAFWALATTFGVCEAIGQGNLAATFPTRAIKIIVPFPPGGPTDINIRIIAQRM